MLLNYTPEGAEKRTWPVKLEKLMSAEAEAIEKATGMTYEEFGVALVKGSATSRRALLWIMLKRTEPTLRHAQVEVEVGQIELEFEHDELLRLRDETAKDKDLTDDERAGALAYIDELLGDAAGDEQAPKADESSDVTPISGPSRTSSASPRQRSTA